MSQDEQKRRAAARALDCVTPGMRLGLGTGSTARHFVDLLGMRVAAGLDVVCVPTSEDTRAQAQRLGIRLTTLDDVLELDLTIDGADELDERLRLIKGGGAALLREKIVASASRRMIVIADASKLVARLGAYSLPIEVVPFGQETTRLAVIAAAATVGAHGPVGFRHGTDGRIVVTDGGHVLLDGAFGSIPDPEALGAALNAIPGVVEHGLFLGLATGAILAGADGLSLMGDV